MNRIATQFQVQEKGKCLFHVWTSFQANNLALLQNTHLLLPESQFSGQERLNKEQFYKKHSGLEKG